jgi:hypothetical protein
MDLERSCNSIDDPQRRCRLANTHTQCFLTEVCAGGGDSVGDAVGVDEQCFARCKLSGLDAEHASRQEPSAGPVAASSSRSPSTRLISAGSWPAFTYSMLPRRRSMTPKKTVANMFASPCVTAM